MSGKTWTPKAAFWGLLLALTIAGALWAWERYSGGTMVFLAACRKVPPGTWAKALLGSALFFFLDYARYWCLLRLFGYRLSALQGLRLTCVSYFATALTPVAELHLPAVTYWMTLTGIPAPIGAAVTITKSLYTTLWICLMAVLSLPLAGGTALPPSVAGMVYLALIPVAAFVVCLAMVAAFPDRIHDWARANSLRGSGVRRTLATWLDHSAAAISRIGRSLHPLHLLCHACCIALVLVYAWLGRALAAGVGLPLGHLQALAVFANSLMVFYLAPIPGSVGVTEWATAYLLDPAVSPDAWAVAVLVRLLTWYVVLPGGAALVAWELWRKGLAPLLDAYRMEGAK